MLLHVLSKALVKRRTKIPTYRAPAFHGYPRKEIGYE